MRLDEFIQHLQTVQKEHGNMEVVFRQRETDGLVRDVRLTIVETGPDQLGLWGERVLQHNILRVR